MVWFISRHVYYVLSKEYVAFVAMLHLGAMVLTGYGVFHHASTAGDVQSNIWAISLPAALYLVNMCVTKWSDELYHWYLPVMVMVSVMCFFMLSAYHGLILVFAVYLPLIAFSMTGIPRFMLVCSSALGLLLGVVFHVMLMSSLHVEDLGERVVFFAHDVAGWMRPSPVRGTGIVMVDACIVIAQIVMGIFCYNRYVKMGHIFSLYRKNPARYLGDFSALRELEDEFLPPASSREISRFDSASKVSDPTHHSPQQADDEDSDPNEPPLWEQFSTMRSRGGYGRGSSGPRGAFRSRQSSRVSGWHGPEADMDISQLSSIDFEVETMRNHYWRKSRGQNDWDLLLHNTDYNAASSHPSASRRSAALSSGSDTASSNRSRGVTWVQQLVDSSRDFDVETGRRSPGAASITTSRSFILAHRSGEYGYSGMSTERDLRGGQYVDHIPLHPAITMGPHSRRTSQSANSLSSDQGFMHLPTDRVLRFTSNPQGVVMSERIGLGSRNASYKSWFQSSDDIASPPWVSSHGYGTQYFIGRPVDTEDAGQMRLGSFEGAGYVQRHSRLHLDSDTRQEGNVYLLRPVSFPNSVCASQVSAQVPDDTAKYPLTASSTMNTLLRSLPYWSHRYLAMLLRAINSMSCDRDVMYHYTWLHIPTMPALNAVGVFAHVQIEMWYVEWMHEFNSDMYAFTLRDSMMIFTMGLCMNTLLSLRVYCTLDTHDQVVRFFSAFRITLLLLRYFAHPVCMFFSTYSIASMGYKIAELLNYRMLLLLSLLNTAFTFADIWSCAGIDNSGYAVHYSLFMQVLMITTAIGMLARSPTLVCLFAFNLLGYAILMYTLGCTVGFVLLELMAQVIVSTGILLFYVRTVDSNRRMLFSLHTLPYLYYLEMMRLQAEN